MLWKILKAEDLAGSELELEVEIDAGALEDERPEALDLLGKNITVPGFRSGHVPENILAAKIGEGALLEEMARRAISRFWPEIIKEKKIQGLGRPEFTITKLARGNPLEFKVKLAVLPEFKLPDYKKIAAATDSNLSPEKRRLEIIEKIIQATEMVVPQVLIKQGFNEKQVKFNLIFDAIAQKENIQISPGEIKNRVDLLTKAHPKVPVQTLTHLAFETLRNERVFQLLEQSGDDTQ